jgi:ribosomal protein S18 acetylase RimI-like enzyme
MAAEASRIRVDVMRPGSEDDVLAAAHLFDHPLHATAVRAFLADDRHHLLVAYVEGQPAGFVSAVDLLHPDKLKPETFLYELGVDPQFRRMGVATQLMTELIALCQERGAGEMFVLTDEANAAAMTTYRNAGGRREADQVMFHWQWPPAQDAPNIDA